MDNSYILLLIIKKEINVGAFITWCNSFVPYVPKYKDYISCDDYDLITHNNKIYKSRDSLGVHALSEFEFNYFVSYLIMVGSVNYG